MVQSRAPDSTPRSVVFTALAAAALVACGSPLDTPRPSSTPETGPTVAASPTVEPSSASSEAAALWPGRLAIVTGPPDGTVVQVVSSSGVSLTVPGSSPAWSPDGRQLAYVGLPTGELPSLWITPTMGGGSAAATEVLPDVISVTWSPAGSWLAIGRSPIDLGDTWVLHPDGSGLASVAMTGAETRVDLWSPDGAAIAGLASIGGATAPLVSICMVPAGTCVAYGPGAPLGWSPDGTLLSIATPLPLPGAVSVLDPTTGASRLLEEGGAGLASAVWSTDARIATVDAAGRLAVLDAIGREPRPLAADLTVVGPVAWSPDGRWLAVRANVASGQDVVVLEVDGPRRDQITHDAGSVFVVWDPAG